MPNDPTEAIATDDELAAPEEGAALCLSGGGYRAMVFHVGVLWRLYEAGRLATLKRISSVSGGSITAGVLAVAWRKLSFAPESLSAEFLPNVVAPVRALAGETIDGDAIVLGALLPGSISDRVTKAYDSRLFHGATLQDLPDAPRFVINATNVQSGALWRFMKPAMRDWRVGEVKRPAIPLARAVAASSAFPPVLSPCELRLDPATFTPGSGADLQREPFTSRVVLTDGGVYDNLGLETAWKRYTTIFVSDAGGKLKAEEEPKTDWARHAYRVLDVVDNQVRSLRKRQVVDSFKAGARTGAYWGIRTNIADYGLGDALPCPHERTMTLAETPTRLKRFADDLQDRLINWGYAVCDAALRAHVAPTPDNPAGFPYPAAGV
jgi:NTE family protein